MKLSFRLLLILAPAVILFGVMGNTHEPQLYGPSIFSWLFLQWMDPGSNSAHGWLIFIVSGYLVWMKRRRLAELTKAVDHRALLFIVFFLFCYWAGYRAQQPRGGVIAMIGLFWAVPYYLWGRTLASEIFFPCVFLLFAVPMNFLSSITFPLRLISCSGAVLLVNGLGIEAERIGTAIYSPTGVFQPLDVYDPCSGLNSIIALAALSAVYAYLTQKTPAGKWLLFLCSIPIAIFGNVVRITVIAIAASLFGSETGVKFYHDYSGYVVFITAVLLLLGLGRLLNWLISGVRNIWNSKKTNHT